jgi:UDP-N-acetylmuramate: L-alanyl-gamma-D-glutamyl-meso-diaminopimelate ligase
MKIHFIAIGGSAMHNLAISLKIKGYDISGSDDEIFEPSKSRLKAYGILPEIIGWDSEKITQDIDAIVLGMHAREDNPELIKAKHLGLKVYSYPEFIYEQSKNKKRIVVGGSHGKTTITSMILHVLNYCNISCDYMVGAQLEGFDVMVKLTHEAPYIVIEGDEYLTSPLDHRPKFHVYQPDTGIISGIAWDHINVFPTFENYIEQFKIFANLIPADGILIYCEDDEHCRKIAKQTTNCKRIWGYTTPDYVIEDHIYKIVIENKKIPLQVFGKHNLQNINAARLACNSTGISDDDFYRAIQTFKGASKRLECVYESLTCCMYKDFAHSPSKLKATIDAVKEKFNDRKLVACIELHTFSSLTADFLKQYAHTMNNADYAFVYFNPHTLQHKKLPPIENKMISAAFENENIQVYQQSKDLIDKLLSMKWENQNLLMMSSGNFDGIDYDKLAACIFKNEL